MNTMRAVRAHRRGGPEQLVYEAAPRPEPAPGEVLVAVHAASITAGELTWDATWTDSLDPGGRDRTPIIPSHEMSGVVAALGPGVTGMGVGDEVYGLIPFVRDGAAAEYVTAAADIVAAKPVNLDHDAAAAVPLAALTVWQALVDHASLRAGQHILIHGAAGGVGSFAVQIAADLGARVTATARGRDRDFVTGLGAHEVLDYASERFEDRVHSADVVLDLVGGETQARSWGVLRPGGVLVSVSAPPEVPQHTAQGVRGVFFIVEPNRAELETIALLIETDRLTPMVDRIVPLTETRAAYEALQAEHKRGKIVIRVAEG
ncbi:NADP-dependent oxidoreductase [Dactylosporangium matsuzakiense]|uniref:NADPH:quinone reductase n=1 Tax=Dactylosporangium matsuzakiense TaxID=53360 RepID=A0A9W6NSW1_9ACTN|nr:NADP-dependent oxidoreductase [Dactylosporangium matsuzakiense]GLL07751.1 NADPH:quinone reductase [Dactylosporangium matsuzakiense]